MIEERLKLFHYSSNKKGFIRWPKRLRSSLYSEACEYFKQLQRDEIDFSAKIQSLKDHSYHQYNDLVEQQRKFRSAPSSCLCVDDKSELKGEMKELKKDMNEVKNEVKELKNSIENLCKQMKI